MHKKLLSLILAFSMLGAASPVVSATETTTAGDEAAMAETVTTGKIQQVISTEGAINGTVTFTEYNDKENEMYKVAGVNRLNARTDAAMPYQNEATALASARDYAKETSSRIKALTGEYAPAGQQWDMTVVKNLEMGAERGLINADGTTNAFADPEFVQDSNWKTNVSMPSSWTSYGDWWNNVNTPSGENDTWVWDYPIYDNVKMPWQSGEQPYDSDDPKTGTYGMIEPGEAPVKYNPIGFYRTTVNIDDLTVNDGDRVRISFQGVESAYYVFIDGNVIGYSEDSYRPHEFDITDYVSDGEDHTLAVRVHKFSDGTWLEDQDMIYDGGIFRDVYLISVPTVSIEDYKIETEFTDETYTDANWIIRDLKLKNNTASEIQAGYEVTANLYDRDAENFDTALYTMTFTTDQAIPAGQEFVFDDCQVKVTAPDQWSAEKPNLYLMSLNLEDNSGSAIESTAQLLGFREIEFTQNVDTEEKAQTEASYYTITINGQPLLMKGTNRHDSDPIAGKYVSKEVYDIDLQTMKQYNINTIRTSHYANDEYLYYLADTYGFYIMAETNAECHAVAQRDRTNATVYNEYLGAIFKDRTITSYQTLKNHSSIVSWSIGNECGSTSAENSTIYYWMTDYFHDNDPTRFVHSEFMQWNEHTDTESNMYPTVEKTQSMAVNPDMPATGNSAGKPFFLCEYVHAMGNAMGDLEGYWNAIRSGENMIGGCIWDWVDQSRIVPLSRVANTEDNTVKKTDSNSNIVPDPYDYYANGKYLAHEDIYGQLREGWFFGYGGDWGDINFEGRNVAADGSASGGGRGNFSGNGLVSPDRQVQPEIYEVKYQYQSFWFKETPIYTQRQIHETSQNGWTTDDLLGRQQVAVYNENNFTNLNEYDINWTLTENGRELGSGTVSGAAVPSVAPKASGTISIPYAQYLPDTLMAGGEYKLYVEVAAKEDAWGVNAGHEVAHEQFDLSDEVLTAVKGAAPQDPTPAEVGGEGVTVAEDDDKFTVTGTNFSFKVSKSTGFLSNYVYNGETLIHQLKPNYYRDAHANDSPQIDNWKFADQEENIIPVTNTINTYQLEDGRYVIDVGVKLRVPYDGDEYAKELLRYIIDESGAVTYRMYLDTTDMPNQTKDGRYILRLGSEMKLDDEFEDITWYGNGIDPIVNEDGEYGYCYPVSESYRERDSYAVKGIYSSTATDMFFPHFDTQETGTVNNVSWAVMDNGTTAILASANTEYKGLETDPNWEASDKNALEVSALHYSTKDLRNGTMHPYELVSTNRYTMEEGYTYFNIDHKSLGIGNSSCGPQQRLDARINTGYIFDYEYTFKPIPVDETAAYDDYTAESIALSAVENSTDIPEFAVELGSIGYTTPEGGLPETVTVYDEETQTSFEESVVWDAEIEDCEVYEDTAITGTLSDGTVVEGVISVYPDNMYYFVDCNDNDASVFNGVKSISENTLVNAVGDQTGVQDGWGLASDSSAYGSPSGNASVVPGDKYATGWYLNAGATLDYQFTLEPGRYSVTAGFGEFWLTNSARHMNVKVTDSEGVQLGETGTATLNGQADPQILRAKTSVGFTLNETEVITVSISKAGGADPLLSWIGIAQALPQTIAAQDGITATAPEEYVEGAVTAYEGDTVTVSGNFAKNSLFVTDENGELSTVTYNDDGTASFTMPKRPVHITGLVNTDTTTYVAPDTIERVRGGSETDNRNYFIAGNRALGMTFTIPEGEYTSAALNFIRQNTAPGQLTNVYDQTESGFSYVNGEGYIAQYSGNSQTDLALSEIPTSGKYKLLLAYDASVSSSASGNDYYVIAPVDNSGNVSANQIPQNVSQLPYLKLTSGTIDPPPTASAEPEIRTWETVADEFTGELPDYNIVWYKYSGDSDGGSHAYKDGVMTISSESGAAATDVCYGVSAIIKNIKPNTKYTISFEENSNITERVSHGFYLNGDTLTMEAGATVPSDANIEVASEVRNNIKIGDIHTQAVSDSGWEKKSFTWTSGSGLPAGMDTYAAKFTFILRGSVGTVQIRNLEMTGEAAVTEPEVTPTPTASAEPTPTATAAPTEAPTSTPEPTGAPISTPVPTATTQPGDGWNVEYDGAANTATVTVPEDAQAGERINLYIAEYGEDGILTDFETVVITLEDGKTEYEVNTVRGIVQDDNNRVRTFLWDSQNRPLI